MENDRQVQEDKKWKKKDISGNQKHGYAVDNNCVGCGICADVSPYVFHMSEQGHADTDPDPTGELDPVGAAQAMAACPVGAIEKK